MKAKILMIDDDNDLLRSMQVVLENEGFEVKTSDDAQNGFALLKSENPDLLILDVIMKSNLEGYYLMQKIKSDPAYLKLPVIIMTSIKDQLGVNLYSAVEDETMFPNVRHQDKPVNFGEFIRLIREMLNG